MKYEVIKYPDNTQYVRINKFSDRLDFRLNSYEDLWTLRQIKDVCDFNNQEVDLYIPCLLDAQADKRFNNNESSGLKLVCEFINSMKFRSVYVFHPHNPEVVEALLENVIVLDNSGFINRDSQKVIGKLITKFDNITSITTEDNLILFSSDAGGFKPLMKIADKLGWRGEVYSASKSRKYEEGKSKLVQVIDRQDFQGKDILIIDDICVYGGTFVGLAKMLKERNCGKLFLAVSHLSIQNPNEELYEYFDTIFTTDSKGFEYQNEKIEVLVNN